MTLPDHVISLLSEKKEDGLISPFKNELLRASSYDLTVGEEYYIGKEGVFSSIETERIRRNQSFKIPPHAVCFILTEETINLPKDITAKVSLRMTHIYAGIILTSQPPFDPGYKGKVILMLYNLSSKSICMKRGERIATIEFSRLEKASMSSKVHRSVSTIEEQLTQPIISSLSEIARASKSAKRTVTWLASNTLVFVTLIVAVLAVPGFFTYKGLSERLDDQKEKIVEMKNMIEKYESGMDTYKKEIDYLNRSLGKIKPSLIDMEVKEASITPQN
ncbi:dCTP deaminase [Bowmanella dokdonensis]|uniref:dUTPase-like domain-containing protein n=1 Tax=Bowmanella dokdonensis TaxID=751969 RepID=A0A939IQN6_9ALTE|nr:hypothetical protein [Bowmanella dokdonensis]MBN7827130.1 hypothetical protein [Bowmanella dokdonensis]